MAAISETTFSPRKCVSILFQILVASVGNLNCDGWEKMKIKETIEWVTNLRIKSNIYYDLYFDYLHHDMYIHVTP